MAELDSQQRFPVYPTYLRTTGQSQTPVRDFRPTRPTYYKVAAVAGSDQKSAIFSTYLLQAAARAWLRSEVRSSLPTYPLQAFGRAYLQRGPTYLLLESIYWRQLGPLRHAGSTQPAT